MIKEIYLGDGLGGRDHEVFLEPAVLKAFMIFVEETLKRKP
jgi:hypothetical protein